MLSIHTALVRSCEKWQKVFMGKKMVPMGHTTLVEDSKETLLTLQCLKLSGKGKQGYTTHRV